MYTDFLFKTRGSEFLKGSTKEIIIILFLQPPISDSQNNFKWVYASWGKRKSQKQA